MQNKLQELTEKIYREGLEKGNEEAASIINQARIQALEIVASAKEEEQKILNEASRKARELKENAESEMKLAVRQSMNSMKQKVTESITAKVVEGAVQNITSDPAFIKELILSITGNWSAGDAGRLDLNVTLPAAKQKELNDYFVSATNKIMNKGIELKFDSRLKSGFEIGPADGSFRISFSDEVFESFFKEYLRPRLMEYLFGK
jgi:V/A-type H+-transporting ATPase subunit E